MTQFTCLTAVLEWSSAACDAWPASQLQCYVRNGTHAFETYSGDYFIQQRALRRQFNRWLSTARFCRSRLNGTRMFGSGRCSSLRCIATGIQERYTTDATVLQDRRRCQGGALAGQQGLSAAHIAYAIGIRAINECRLMCDQRLFEMKRRSGVNCKYTVYCIASAHYPGAENYKCTAPDKYGIYAHLTKIL